MGKAKNLNHRSGTRLASFRTPLFASMEIVGKLVDVLLYTVPAAAVILMGYLMLKQYLDHIKRAQDQDWKQRQQKHYMPVMMQSYERLIMLLERIHPESLVFRVHKPGMSARLIQADMLKVIRDEFDHNLTQQLYLSNEAWSAVKAAKEETIKIVKVAASQSGENADGMKMAESILKLVSQMDKLPTEVAIDILKSEFRKRMRS